MRGRAASRRRPACAPWRWARPTACSAARTSSTPARRSPCRWARRRSAACSTWSASRSTTAARSPPRSAAPIHQTAARDRRAVLEDRDLRDRHQGHRPALPAGARRQGRPVRRRRRRQDGHHPGADRPPRPLPLRLLAASPASASAPARATTSGSRCRRPRSATPARAVIDQTVMVFGQMNEPPGARLRVALSALTMAEYFRDQTGADTLLFIDNIFRFTQAGSEVSALLGRMPSAVGYQPTLATEMGELQERITSTKRGAVTSIQAIYVPADDYTDPAPANAFTHLDCDREPRARDRREGHLPRRRSAGLVAAASSRPRYIGERHYAVARRVQQILQRYKDLQDIIAILGIDELSEDDKIDRPPGAQDRALLLAAVLRRRAVHRLRRHLLQARGHDPLVRGALRRQVGPPARPGVHVRRHDRGSGGQGREDGRLGLERDGRRPSTAASSRPSARCSSARRRSSPSRRYDGEMGILADRAPLLAKLGAGELRVESPEGDARLLRRRRLRPDGRRQADPPHRGGEGRVAELDAAAAKRELDAALALPASDELHAQARDKAVNRARALLRVAS